MPTVKEVVEKLKQEERAKRDELKRKDEEDARQRAEERARLEKKRKECVDLVRRIGLGNLLAEVNRDYLGSRGKLRQTSGIHYHEWWVEVGRDGEEKYSDDLPFCMARLAWIAPGSKKGKKYNRLRVIQLGIYSYSGADAKYLFATHVIDDQVSRIGRDDEIRMDAPEEFFKEEEKVCDVGKDGELADIQSAATERIGKIVYDFIQKGVMEG